jgi:hypothetical protein
VKEEETYRNVVRVVAISRCHYVVTFFVVSLYVVVVVASKDEEPAPRSQFKLQSPKISCDLGAEIHLLKVLSSQLQITQLVSKTRPLPHCIQQPPPAQRRRVGLDGWF